MTKLQPIPTPEATLFERAHRSRDPRFDGRFFVGVHSTGVYCRPICPAPPAKPENVVYYRSAAAAAAAGLRPCLRCRPEAAPATPAWAGTVTTVARALRLIEDGALDNGAGVGELASRLGVGDRHLRRLFVHHLGAPPAAVAGTRRLHFARRLLAESDLRIVDVAFAAGFGSVRRFNQAFREAFDCAPGELRRNGARAVGGCGFEFRLAYRPPFDWDGLLSFLAVRAVPGVEQVSDGAYRRTLRWRGLQGRMEVRLAENHHLALRVRLTQAPSPLPSLLLVVQRVRGLFDLDADPAALAEHLGDEPLIGPLLRERPGVRLPGAWDGFEIAVRAILGQQVSVKGATTLAGRLVARHGESLSGAGGSEPSRHFPEPVALVGADLETIGLPRARAAAIRALARAVVGEELELDGAFDLERAVERLVALPGIGPWTAHYYAMRALRLPDAFPAGDLVLRRAVSDGGRLASAREVEARAEPWRPWRAYAARLLWHAAVEGRV